MPRLPGAALARGIGTAYLSLIVLLPLAAVVDRSMEGGIDSFWSAVTAPQAVAALLRLLLGTRVRIVRKGTGGRIEIDFGSEDELIRIYEQMTDKG